MLATYSYGQQLGRLGMDEQNKKELLRKRMKSIARGYLQFAEAFSYYCYLLRQDETPENRMAFIKQVGVSLDRYGGIELCPRVAWAHSVAAQRGNNAVDCSPC